MKSRSGAIDYGRIYEQKIAAILSIRLALDPSVTDFWIVSNIDDFGAFDDIVLLVENRDGTRKIYCIQLKHIENRSLQASQLEADKGNFRLDKYLESYQTIRENITRIDVLKGIHIDQIYFILYTNAPLSNKDNAVYLKLENKPQNELLCTTPKLNSVFQVYNSTKNSPKPFEESFLRQFFLYTNQASAPALDRLIKNEFEKHFEDISNTVVITVTDYFLKWAVGHKKRIKRIYKKDVQIKLMECLLQPYIIEPRYGVATVTEAYSKFKLLNETLMSFNITPVMDERSLGNVFDSCVYILEQKCDIQLNPCISWNASLLEMQHEALQVDGVEEKKLIKSILKEKQHFVAHLTIKDLYLSAWQCNVIPLVLHCQNIVKKILFKFEVITKSRSFVLFEGENLNLEWDLKIFNTFNDIVDVSLINRNLESTFVSLQGKAQLSLKEFQSYQVLKEITPDVYMLLLNGVLQIGDVYEIEDYYIKRSLQIPSLSYDVLDESNVVKGDIFLLVEFNADEYLYIPGASKYEKHMVDLATYLSSSNDKYIVTTVSRTKEEIAQDIILIQEKTNKSIHAMQWRQSSLRWLFSKGPIDILQDYLKDTLDEDSYIEEDSMLDYFKSDINIITGNAGMGKTFILKSLANKFDSNKWVCLVDLSEVMQKDPMKYLDYIMECCTRTSDDIASKLCREIFLNRWSSKNMVWLLDGYDEVASQDIAPFFKQIKTGKVWITTRLTYKRDLEKDLNTLSIQIAHFKEKDNAMFLWKYYETFHDFYNYNKQQVEQIITLIHNQTISLNKTFVVIPLQIRMLAEIFGDNIDENTKPFTIIDLYTKFVDVKLKEYKPYEATSLRKTLSKLALKLYFPKDQLEDLLDLEELAEEALTFQESYKKDSIVIGLNENGDAIFGHKSFADYLAADWLTKKIITKKGFNLNWRTLVDKIYYVDLISVRLFFDRILCQKLQLHSAILNNIDHIELLLNKETIKEVDNLGRSPLHLAVSYGKYYDIQIPVKVKETHTLGSYNLVTAVSTGCRPHGPIIKTEHQIPLGVIEQLLEQGCVNTPDKLFNYDAFDYAMKSCSLDVVNCLFEKLDKDNLLFEPGFNFSVFLYCIVYDNLHNILSGRKIYHYSPGHHEIRSMFLGYNAKFLKMQYNGLYLTELAAYLGHKEILFELVLQTGFNEGLPLHKACHGGYSDVVELLCKMGANVNQQDIIGWSPFLQSGNIGRVDLAYHFLKEFNVNQKTTLMTPLHYASQRGRLGCIKVLIEFGASVTIVDAFGYTPLYYATLYGYMDCVEFMLKILPEEEKRAKEIQCLINIAASKGYSVAKLIQCGLDVNNFDKNGNTPLILASKHGFHNVIKELARSKKCDLNLMNANENFITNLETNLMHGIEKLIEWALDVNNIDNQGNTPLTIAIKDSFPKGFQELTPQNNVLNLNKINESLKNISESTRRRFISFVNLCPIGKNQTVLGGKTALHFAVEEGHINCAKALIDAGADKSIEDTIGIGYSPLIWAAINGRHEIVEALLASKPKADNVQRELEASKLNPQCIKMELEASKVSSECIEELEATKLNSDCIQRESEASTPNLKTFQTELEAIQRKLEALMPSIECIKRELETSKPYSERIQELEASNPNPEYFKTELEAIQSDLKASNPNSECIEELEASKPNLECIRREIKGSKPNSKYIQELEASKPNPECFERELQASKSNSEYIDELKASKSNLECIHMELEAPQNELEASNPSPKCFKKELEASNPNSECIEELEASKLNPECIQRKLQASNPNFECFEKELEASTPSPKYVTKELEASKPNSECIEELEASKLNLECIQKDLKASNLKPECFERELEDSTPNSNCVKKEFEVSKPNSEGIQTKLEVVQNKLEDSKPSPKCVKELEDSKTNSECMEELEASKLNPECIERELKASYPNSKYLGRELEASKPNSECFKKEFEASEPNSECIQRQLEDAEIALIWASILGFEATVTILLNSADGLDDLESIRNRERIEDIVKSECSASNWVEVKNVPLIVAVINNRPRVIRILTSKRYKNNVDLNTALFCASKLGYLDCVRVLIESGGDDSIKIGGITPVAWASLHGQAEVVKFFLHDKPEDYLKKEDVVVALNIAAKYGNNACVKVLLDLGLDINHVCDYLGGTPFLIACQYGAREVVKELLSRNCDTSIKNSKGLTALELLVKENKFDLVKLVLENGVYEINIGSDLYKGLQTALDWALVNEDYEMIYKLVELGICENID